MGLKISVEVVHVILDLLVNEWFKALVCNILNTSYNDRQMLMLPKVHTAFILGVDMRSGDFQSKLWILHSMLGLSFKSGVDFQLVS